MKKAHITASIIFSGDITQTLTQTKIQEMINQLASGSLKNKEFS